MQRFAIKIDKSVKARLKNLCRLCGIDNPNQIDILNAAEWIDLTIDGEVTLSRKIADCVGIQVMKNDRMPQRICALCVDKINDFYEFREMCEATNVQTRKLLNLPDPAKAKPPKKVTIKTDDDEAVESIFGIVDTDVKTKAEPVQKTAKKSKRTSGAAATTTSENRFKGMTKREIEITLELERIKQEEEEEEKKIATGRTKNGKKKKTKASATDLLAPKEPNQRERKREIEQKRKEMKRKAETKTKPPINKKKIKKEPGISCLVCEERFEKNSFRDAHMLASHRPMTSEYGCSSCLEQFITVAEYNSHHEWHSMFHVPHKCVMCSATFEKLITFQRHVSACIHPSYATMTAFSNSINCELCNEEFETQNLYDWHNCFIGSNSPCPKCHRVFIKKNILMKHFFKCTGPGPVPIEIVPKKAGPKSKKQKPSKTDTQPQNSFKLEPETIIETADDAYDNVDEDMDNSYMDTHFGDSDNEFDGQYNDSIMTTLPINEQGPSTPSCSKARKSTTCTSLGSNTQIRTNLNQPLLECRVKLEPLDMNAFSTSSISINEPTIEEEGDKQQPSKLPTPSPPPSLTVPPLVISRPMVPPLTIRIKKEVIRPGYGDEFDANLARNIKEERVDESYELASTSRATHKISQKKSKHRDKEKKLYKKPALLAIKIKQERMEQEETDNFYPDYSMPTNDFNDTMPTNQSTFETNPLPIITQIHSVLEPPTINPLAYAAPQPNPFATISTTNSIPFRPIRIKCEPKTPPPIDAGDNFIDTPTPLTNTTSLTDCMIPIQNIKKEIHTENEPNEEAADNSVCDNTNTSLHEFDNLNLQTNIIDNVAAVTIEQENQTENVTEAENCSIQTVDAINDSNELTSNDHNVDSETIQPVSNDTNFTTNEQLSESIDETNSMQPPNEIENQLAADPNQILAQTDPQIQDKISSPMEQIHPQIENSENESGQFQSLHEIVPPSNPCETVSPLNEVPANHSNDVTNNEIYENEIAELENVVANESDYANIHDTCQQSTDIIEVNAELESISNAKTNDDENVIKLIGNDDNLDVVVNNENISPIDFNDNDDSLNFIEQLVHEEASKIIPQIDDITENIPVDSSNMQFDACQFVGGSSQLVTDNADTLAAIDDETNADESIINSTTNDTFVTLTDIPDGLVATPEIDYNDFLPEIAATQSDSTKGDVATSMQPINESEPTTANAELPI